MTATAPPRTPEDWLRHLFSAKAAKDGGVVRRSVRDMERWVGRERFLREMERRGFTVVENASQVIVFCNAEPVRVVTRVGANFR
ncbi:MAG: N-(5'-phosphoribosyl)anthranilate isomerase [Pseudomonadota bacterium]